MLSIEKSGIPPWMLPEIKHLASLHNPQFYERQRLRLSTFQTPRFIKCYEEDVTHLHLPRGTLDDFKRLCTEAGSTLSLLDKRSRPKERSFEFTGTLTPIQQEAMQAVLAREQGILVAPPGAGKTVMGCFAVARRNAPTLILAHRKPILEQWRSQLMELLKLPSAQIGQVGGGRSRLSGVVDLGMIQSLKRIEDLEAFFSTAVF
ncbi:MAG: DEAD/DEAH box helicase family protein [Candidatus Omnitrophica bacterium]|nr:DEAD/DEAH box helicase family protein [Candidatus Omnitrophota bacterium]